MKDLKTLQKQEALERLTILQKQYGLMETVLKEFKEDNTIYYSEYINQNIQGILYWVSNKDEYTEIVEEFEKKNNALVYHIISTPVIYGGILLSMLYVSKNQEEWKRDREDLKNGLPLAYCINLADPEMAEVGGIQIKGANGGICQIA